jgi:cyclohexanecarboxyl-CoA dehydrogenase
MRFDFTDDQQALATRVRAFAAERLAPVSQEGDRQSAFAAGLLDALAADGLCGLGIPEAYGGRGADAVSTGIALEELARADLTACYPVLNAALIGGILNANGTDEQRKHWLPPIASGESIVALCLTEPDHGSDAAAIEFQAEPAGDGWRLTGEKTSINLGAYASHGLLFARTGGPGARGITAFYVGLDDPRVTRIPLRDVGSRAGGRSTLVFDGLVVDGDDVIGAPGLGFVQVMRGFDYSRALIALMSVSAASASLDEALAYARSRAAFGKPLGQFQAVAFPLVEHATYLHAARLLAYEALWRKDAGLDHRIEANMAKWWGPKASSEAAHQALLTFGQHGWSEELMLGQRLRDVMGTEIADGTANVTKLVVARQLLGREYAP